MSRCASFGPGARLSARLLAAIPLGYGLVALTVAAFASILPLAGVARADAVIAASVLGFLFYLVWILWAFATCSLLRLYCVLAVSAAVCAAIVFGLMSSGT